MNLKKNPYKDLRTAETSTVKSAIHEMLNTYRIKDKFTATQITASWGTIMGEPIARRTEKVFMKDKKLFVKLNSAPLKNELSLSKHKIKSLFDKEFGAGEVEDIVFL